MAKYCNRCSKRLWFFAGKIFNGEPICSTCYSGLESKLESIDPVAENTSEINRLEDFDTLRCAVCNVKITPSDAAFLVNNQYLCRECIRLNLPNCSKCNAEFSSLTEGFHLNQKLYCESCINKEVAYCSNCGSEHKCDELKRGHNYLLYCDSCVSLFCKFGFEKSGFALYLTDTFDCVTWHKGGVTKEHVLKYNRSEYRHRVTRDYLIFKKATEVDIEFFAVQYSNTNKMEPAIEELTFCWICGAFLAKYSKDER